MRQSRKQDHLKYALALADGPGVSGFADFHLVHNCLPEVSWPDIDLTTLVLGLKLAHPVIINAMTGGARDVTEINAQLAELACRTGAAMAVGSQYAAIEASEVRHSYKVITQVYPDGVFFANLGAHATPDEAKRAVEMIGAAAIQIHVNAAQEMMMAEGDRSFCGYLANIEAIVNSVGVPVIVKETGCGIAKEQALALAATGVRGIDVGGVGGTNFIAIEIARQGLTASPDMLGWGIPTAVSAAEIASILPAGVDLIISGGIRSALDVVKALAIGGSAVGVATPILRVLSAKGVDAATEWFTALLHDMRRFMLLVGAKNCNAVAQKPLVITGFSREWLTARGIRPEHFAQQRQ